jgi:hypothetical protein
LKLLETEQESLGLHQQHDDLHLSGGYGPQSWDGAKQVLYPFDSSFLYTSLPKFKIRMVTKWKLVMQGNSIWGVDAYLQNSRRLAVRINFLSYNPILYAFCNKTKTDSLTQPWRLWS